eukprot:TRINITY_DN25_c1_g1_i2.p1 TRINITY_DN25_c1_g1~~TRINITY_DN25_c1_g1_i2.p1  ORF type:complete len:521 (-),score=106.23 TRINITY_DN25_c1_g1_i2:940-2451(-)
MSLATLEARADQLLLHFGGGSFQQAQHAPQQEAGSSQQGRQQHRQGGGAAAARGGTPAIKKTVAWQDPPVTSRSVSERSRQGTSVRKPQRRDGAAGQYVSQFVRAAQAAAEKRSLQAAQRLRAERKRSLEALEKKESFGGERTSRGENGGDVNVTSSPARSASSRRRQRPAWNEDFALPESQTARPAAKQISLEAAERRQKARSAVQQHHHQQQYQQQQRQQGSDRSVPAMPRSVPTEARRAALASRTASPHSPLRGAGDSGAERPVHSPLLSVNHHWQQHQRDVGVTVAAAVDPAPHSRPAEKAAAGGSRRACRSIGVQAQEGARHPGSLQFTATFPVSQTEYLELGTARRHVPRRSRGTQPFDLRVVERILALDMGNGSAAAAAAAAGSEVPPQRFSRKRQQHQSQARWCRAHTPCQTPPPRRRAVPSMEQKRVRRRASSRAQACWRALRHSWSAWRRRNGAWWRGSRRSAVPRNARRRRCRSARSSRCATARRRRRPWSC